MAKRAEPVHKQIPLDTTFFFIAIEFEIPIEPSALVVKSLVHEAVKSLFGNIGAASYVVDVLDVREAKALAFRNYCQLAVLSLHSEHVVPVRGALTMLGSYHDNSCRVSVLKASPFLMGLTAGRFSATEG